MSLFGQPAQQQLTKPTPVFGQSSGATSSAFGNTQAQKPTTPFVATGGSLFGGGGTAQNNATSGPGLFGSTPAAPTANLFGSTPAANPQGGGGLFGQQPKPAGGGLFGSTAPAQQPAATGLFGAAPIAQPSAGGLFGSTNAQPAGGGLFGSTNNAQPAAGGGLFGSTNNAQPAAGGGLFGSTNNAQPAAGGGLFGSTNTNNQKPAGGLFGASTSQQPQQQQTQQMGGGLFGGGALSQPKPLAGSTSMFSQPSQTPPQQPQQQNQTLFTKNTKFNDLPDAIRGTLEQIETHINGRTQIAKDLKSRKLGEDTQKGQVLVKAVHHDLVATMTATNADLALTKDLTAKTDLAVQDTITATQIIEAVRNPQTNGHWASENAGFPLEYFTRVTESLRERLRWCKSVIDQIERKLASIGSSTMGVTPHTIVNTLRTQHATLQSLAGKLAGLDNELSKIKPMYTKLWQERSQSARDPFDHSVESDE